MRCGCARTAGRSCQTCLQVPTFPPNPARLPGKFEGVPVPQVVVLQGAGAGGLEPPTSRLTVAKERPCNDLEPLADTSNDLVSPSCPPQFPPLFHPQSEGEVGAVIEAPHTGLLANGRRRRRR